MVAVAWWLVGCRPAVNSPAVPGTTPPTAVPQIIIQATRPPLLSPPPTLTLIPTRPTATTFTPTVTAAPTIRPTLTVTLTNFPSPTPPPSCIQRVPQDGLLILVTRIYGLSQDYAPADLVPLSDYFPVAVTLGFPTEVRQVVIEPLTRMIEAMQTAGLEPTIVSGYRSYSAQAIAREKWLQKNPEYGAYLTALPGHSEHQLGTTLDFGSPDLGNELTHLFADT
ncbi:MAG: D-alanyl-D-alanine carboxypeptidase family protein, partial [Chloroflexota bacterium]